MRWRTCSTPPAPPASPRAAFHPDPDGGDARIYRTGDLGLMRPDGCLEHRGRKDAQVKVRGQRVELGEVERALLAAPGVKEAAVVAREERPGDLRLAAYLIPATQPPPPPATVRRALAALLPDYMIPVALVWLERLPLTATGKVDRQALPAPAPGRPPGSPPYVPPRAELERMLAGAWGEVLDLDEVGVHDHFLDIGGDSLLAARILARLAELIPHQLSLATLFRAGTVAELAEAILGDEMGDASGAPGPASPGG